MPSSESPPSTETPPTRLPAERLDVVVVGGGIVGLATARELLRSFDGLRLVLIEKEDRLAAHQTGHSSGVVHSGLYYRPGSQKANTCVRGAAAMLAFCREHGIAHEVCGKVVLATEERERPPLAELERRGRQNGVPGLARIGPDELLTIEPHARALEALFVPGAAIVDYRDVAACLGRLITTTGGEILLRTAVRGIARQPDGLVLRTDRGELRARTLVTCAGLQSDRVTAMEAGRAPARIVPFRGEYRRLRAERTALVRGMIYPVPDPRFPFLGVHLTRTIGGGVEAGPNAVLALAREGYRKGSFDLRDLCATLGWPGFWRMAARHGRTGAAEWWRSLGNRAFAQALERLVPELRAQDLEPGGSGVRAQALARDGALVDDFLLVESQRALHVCNAPSPAATAALAIAEEIVDRFRPLLERARRHGRIGPGAAAGP